MSNLRSNWVLNQRSDQNQYTQRFIVGLWLGLEPDWGQKKYSKVDQEYSKVDCNGLTRSQIRHLDQAYIEFPEGLATVREICNYLLASGSKKSHWLRFFFVASLGTFLSISCQLLLFPLCRELDYWLGNGWSGV